MKPLYLTAHINWPYFDNGRALEGTPIRLGVHGLKIGEIQRIEVAEGIDAEITLKITNPVVMQTLQPKKMEVKLKCRSKQLKLRGQKNKSKR